MSARRGWRRAPVAVAAGVALLTALLGGAVTDVGPWYQALKQPAWKPPDFLFGPAWTLIYTLTAWAAVRCWDAAPDAAARRAVLRDFGLNAGLNLAWSVIFFGLRRPDWALVEVVLLWLSVAWLVGRSRQVPGCTLMLLPYLLWVAFAGALNAAIVFPGA